MRTFSPFGRIGMTAFARTQGRPRGCLAINQSVGGTWRANQRTYIERILGCAPFLLSAIALLLPISRHEPETSPIQREGLSNAISHCEVIQ